MSINLTWENLSKNLKRNTPAQSFNFGKEGKNTLRLIILSDSLYITFVLTDNYFKFVKKFSMKKILKNLN